MLVAVVQFLICATVVVIAGTYLARYADEIAEVTGFGRLVVGSVLLAGATSLPELTVDITAVRNGWFDLAVGDLMGSCLMNLLILAVLDLALKSSNKMLTRAAAGHALSGAMSISLLALVGLALAAKDLFPAGTFLNLSAAGAMIGVAYFMGVRMVFLDQRISVRTATETLSDKAAKGELTQEHIEDLPASVQPPPAKHPPLWKPLLGFAIAAAVIVFVGPWLAESANIIAKESGLGESFVGSVFVAITTSLPEFVATLTALRMGAMDLAVGNVFGSNTFNVFIIAILDLFTKEPILAKVSPANMISCLAAIVVTTIAIMGQLYSMEKRLKLIEPDASLMLLVIGGALYLVYLSSSGHPPM